MHLHPVKRTPPGARTSGRGLSPVPASRSLLPLVPSIYPEHARYLVLLHANTYLEMYTQVESRLWLLLGPFGSVGGMELDEEEAGSRMHVCRGLSGLHLLPALTRNLGILLTARALRKLQENGVVTRHVL